MFQNLSDYCELEDTGTSKGFIILYKFVLWKLFPEITCHDLIIKVDVISLDVTRCIEEGDICIPGYKKP